MANQVLVLDSSGSSIPMLTHALAGVHSPGTVIVNSSHTEVFTMTAPGVVDVRSNPFTTTITKIETSGSGNNTIITPTSGSGLRIVKLMFVCDAATDVTIYEGTVGEGQTQRTGPMAFAANGGFAFDGDAWPMEFATDKSLVVNSSAVAGINGFCITYEE